MQYAPTLTDQKIDFPLKHPTRNDLFFVSLCRGVLHTPHKCPWQWANESSARYVSIKYVFIGSFSCQEFDSLSFIESYTWQKFDSPLSIELSTRYVLGHMQYAPSLTDQKLDSILFIESKTRYVSGRMQYAPTLTDQKIDSLLKPPTPNDPFLVYRCRGVWHTPHKYTW